MKAIVGAWDHTFPHERILDSLSNRGRKADKHGTYWRVFELNHCALIPTSELPAEEVSGSALH